MKYDVTAVCLDPRDGSIIAEPRVEEIDTEANELFADCAREDEVEDMYHTFWNRLNGFTNNYPHGKVVVLTVEKAA